MKKTSLDISILLPDLPNAQDACVTRLEVLVNAIYGVDRAHVVLGKQPNQPATLCIHYDPSIVSLSEVERRAKAAGAKIGEQYGHLLVDLDAMESEDLARRIERSLLSQKGVVTASVNLPGQKALIEFDQTIVSVENLKGYLAELGYAAPNTNHSPSATVESRKQTILLLAARHKELIWSLAAGAILATAYFGEKFLQLPRTAAILLYLLSGVFGSYDLLSHSVRRIRKGKLTLGIDVLMLLAAVGAALLGEYAEGAFLLFLFSLAHAMEHYALGRARNAIKALADLAPPIARVMREGRETEIPIEEVSVGDVVVVRPGERIPVDGKILRGTSAVNQAPVTGESVPVEKTVGAEVFAGTINGDGAMEITSTKIVGDRTLDRVVKLVEEAQTQKAPTQAFTDRFERVFVPVVLVADVLLIAIPPLVGIWPLGESFYRGMALLVAASPCALALGTPAAVLAAIAQAARNGVLIKGGAHLENFGMVRAIAFDKTGTLTTGKPELTDIVAAAGVKNNELLRIAAAVEKRSQHPLAQAIVRKAEADGISLPQAGDVESITARGVRSIVDGKTVEIGSLKLWEPNSVPESVRDAVATLQKNGRSIVVVKHGDQFLGTLGIADEPRKDAAKVLERLRQAGVERLVMLTGDNIGVGNAIGERVKVDEVKADLMPEAKVDSIRELLNRYGLVAMIGDGVNDAPALATSTVGVAMGGTGTAVALETADIALMADDLGKLPFAVELSRKARSVIRQNLYTSLGVIAVLIVATTTGFAGIGLAVIVHEGSTLVVIANALRLLGVRDST